jgi:hypothetical protein
MSQKKPGNLIAAWWNIIICAVIIVGAASFAFTTSPFGFLVAGVGVAMEVFFVRALVEIHKERASAPRLTEDRHQDEDRPNHDAEDRRDPDS